MSGLIIGIERGPEGEVSEEAILNYFMEKGFDHDDDYLSKGNSRIEYFVVEKARYIIFKEENDVDLFTEVVVDFIRTLEEGDRITVKDENIPIQKPGEEVVFEGSAPAFIGFWDTLGDV